MSFLNDIANSDNSDSSDKLVIPCVGKMIYSNITKLNKALCFVVNKAYIQSDDLRSIITILRSLKEEDGFFFVGEIEKIALEDSDAIVYRQRIYFKDFGAMLDKTKYYGLVFELEDGFHIDIDSIADCYDSLPYLKVYANNFGETIEEYLTNTFKIQLCDILKFKQIKTVYEDEIPEILKNKEGYLNRAPLILCSFSFENHKASIFMIKDFADKRMYKGLSKNNLDEFGFTYNNIHDDKKKKIFDK